MNVHARKIATAPLVIERLDELRRVDLDSMRERSMPRAALMCRSTYFCIEHEINDFMSGKSGTENGAKAALEWSRMVKLLGYYRKVEIADALPGNQDMVFAANAALTFKERKGARRAVMSNMKHSCRKTEMPHYQNELRKRRYDIITLPEHVHFEGQGDALWHPGKMLLWGGYGHRSIPEAYAQIADILDIPVILLELVSKFYHLDTCFCPLDPETALYYPEAFSREGAQMIEWMFPNAIRVTKKQAEEFACNLIAVDKYVLMPEGDGEFARTLGKLGYTVHFLAMSEFLKSGGAVRCLALDLY